MKPLMTASIAVLLSLVPAVSLVAHHSLANYDTSTAVRVKGTILQLHLINPHSIVYVEEKMAEGQVRRWAVEGPSIVQLRRQGLEKALKPGDEIQVCGYVPKEALMWQVISPDSTRASLWGRLINAELLVMPDGRQQSWGDYGAHKCFAPGYHDHHSN
jgi:Family of unknown function (DUF6152)